jgi:hypothetical protein
VVFLAKGWVVCGKPTLFFFNNTRIDILLVVGWIAVCVAAAATDSSVANKGQVSQQAINLNQHILAAFHFVYDNLGHRGVVKHDKRQGQRAVSNFVGVQWRQSLIKKCFDLDPLSESRFEMFAGECGRLLRRFPVQKEPITQRNLDDSIHVLYPIVTWTHNRTRDGHTHEPIR